MQLENTMLVILELKFLYDDKFLIGFSFYILGLLKNHNVCKHTTVFLFNKNSIWKLEKIHPFQ